MLKTASIIPNLKIKALMLIQALSAGCYIISENKYEHPNVKIKHQNGQVELKTRFFKPQMIDPDDLGDAPLDILFIGGIEMDKRLHPKSTQIRRRVYV